MLPRMFDHVTIRVSDRDASVRFYGLVLQTIGIEPTSTDEDFPEWDDFSLAQADEEHPVTQRLHIGFVAPSREHVDAFWRAGTQAGYRDDGAPGLRPQYSDDYYGAFLLDPDGNSAEAVHHADVAGRGVVDHLWIRVEDVEAAKAFYTALAPHTGAEPHEGLPGHAHFGGAGGSFTAVADDRPATEQLHMAFPGADREAVAAFHRDALAAGYRDNGGPGERPEYHEGYYGAFVLDPDGNNVEMVFHDR
jgi:catechol 2,3-dioxygenase-like lactoylglutathione lyase family enzyme